MKGLDLDNAIPYIENYFLPPTHIKAIACIEGSRLYVNISNQVGGLI